MKLHIFAVLLVAAGTCALPRSSDVLVQELSDRPSQRNFVEDHIRWVIERIGEVIKHIGLDPIEVEERSFEIDPSFIDIRVAGIVEELRFAGLGNIRINNLEYSLIFSRLRLDVSLPEISLVVGNSALEANFFESEFYGVFKGSLSIKSVRLAAEVHLNVDLDGISLRNIAINFSLGGIESDLSLVVQENDRSDALNNFLGVRIPAFLKNNESDINRVLEDVVSFILNRIWSL